MPIAVISDIHSNLEALTAVLDEIDAREIEEIVCLGDVVGYGADPGPCVDLIRERCALTVLGNHDEAVARGDGEGYLPVDGRTAARQNHDQLSEEQLDWLAGLPLVETWRGSGMAGGSAAEERPSGDAGSDPTSGHAATDRNAGATATFVHATPEQPGEWLRIGAFSSTRAQFDHFETDVCFIGHTHVPGLVADRIGVLSVRQGHRYLVNVGSVGQPRDGDPRASFAVFDPEDFTCDIVRVPYDIDRAAKKIRSVGLPPGLAERLRMGA